MRKKNRLCDNTLTYDEFTYGVNAFKMTIGRDKKSPASSKMSK